MATMKKTLLEITQDILNDLTSDSVNSISDTIEATQVANIVAQTYFDMIADKEIPEHLELFRLIALSDSTRPNYMRLDDDVSRIDRLWYNKSKDSEQEYQEVWWEDPLDFLSRTSNRNSASADTDTVLDFNGDTELLIFNDKFPTYYTSFDNKHICMDAYHSTYDSTLQASKSRGYGELLPEVTISDSFTFDFEAKFFPLLVAEAKSRAFTILPKTANAKVEQTARKHRSFIQEEKFRFAQDARRKGLVGYGRR